MSIYAHIKRCLELSDREIASAIADRRLTKALLDQLSKVSKPSDGAPKLLLFFAKMASQDVEWVDGALRIEMAGDADVTTVEVLCEMGLGMHERVVPSFKMNVPLEEFVRAVERVPHMIEPLTIVTSSEKRLVLTSSTEEEEDPEDAAASTVPIADDSLYHRTPSRDKMPAVVVPTPAAPIVAPVPVVAVAPVVVAAPGHAAPKVRAVRRSSRPEMPAVTPKIISSRSGKTLRPAPPAPPAPDAPPPSQRVVPVVPKAPALPGAQAKSAQPEVKRSAIARVPLTKIQVPRGAIVEKGGTVKAPPSATKRASKPPGKRMSVKPPAAPAKKGSKPPPRTSARPPAKSKRSEPPEEESIDLGWDEDS